MYLIFASVELSFTEFIAVKKRRYYVSSLFICIILLCIFYHRNTASPIFERVHLYLGRDAIF